MKMLIFTGGGKVSKSRKSLVFVVVGLACGWWRCGGGEQGGMECYVEEMSGKKNASKKQKGRPMLFCYRNLHFELISKFQFLN